MAGLFNTTLMGFAPGFDSFDENRKPVTPPTSGPNPPKTGMPDSGPNPPAIDNSVGGLSNSLSNTYQSQFAPMATSLVNRANEMDTPEEQERMAGRASADVTRGFNKNKQALEMSLAASGVSPGSPAYQSALAKLTGTFGLADAAAQTNARVGARDRALDFKSNLFGLGTKLAPIALQGYQIGGAQGLARDELALKDRLGTGELALKGKIADSDSAYKTGMLGISNRELDLKKAALDQGQKSANSQNLASKLAATGSAIGWALDPKNGVTDLVSKFFGGGGISGGTDFGSIPFDTSGWDGSFSSWLDAPSDSYDFGSTINDVVNSGSEYSDFVSPIMNGGDFGGFVDSNWVF